MRLDLHNSPTALNKRGNKVYMDGYRFDSQKECDFYAKFIRDSGVKFDIHPRYELLPLKELGVYKTRSISYTPDVVTYGDEDEEMRWFPLFIRTPNGIECQFGQRDDILSNAKLRINETPNDSTLGDK